MKRALKGRIKLLEAGRDPGRDINPQISFDEDSGLLVHEQWLAKNVKKIALMVIGTAA
jgi:hypothetical protein